jgi:protein-S-isoprenylcysteine O-methyltransferase Ste14
MYLGVWCAILGEIIVFSSRNLLVYLGVVILIQVVFVMLYEEPTLRRLFGDAYGEYCRTVPRWLPRPPRSGLGGEPTAV